MGCRLIGRPKSSYLDKNDLGLNYTVLGTGWVKKFLVGGQGLILLSAIEQEDVRYNRIHIVLNEQFLFS